MKTIKTGHLDHPAVIELLTSHVTVMAETSPAESRHALDLNGLKQPSISFYSLWETERLAGVAALMKHEDALGEVKSMKTHPDFVRRGVARTLLSHLILDAKSQGLRVLKLETGSMDYFAPAHALYRSFGFLECEPFGSYRHDPNSLFFELDLQANQSTT
jgi:putative acetyltransferase